MAELGGRVTVLTPGPVPLRSSPLALYAMLPVAWGVMIGVSGSWVIGLVVAPSGLVIVPLAYLLARWLSMRPNAGRLEIRANRILVVTAAGVGSQLHRADGDLLRAKRSNRRLLIFQIGPDGSEAGSLDIHRFDAAAVGDAVREHGWWWQPRGGTEVLAPTGGAVPPPAQRQAHGPSGQIEIVLRTGGIRPAAVRYALFGTLGLTLAVVVAAVVLDIALPSWLGYLPLALLLAFVLVGGFAILRLSGVTVTVDAVQLSVKYGSMRSTVVQRNDIASAEAGKRWARLRNRQGRQLIWVPLRPRRDEVLAALRSTGWPVTDTLTGV